ncbi:hypothetical protein [Pedobacter aquatilis]|uniref:hypothetical protein n=1 Tax=Pedobacter aquatilis TaxID=351343 RepID=UPI00292F3233|nr:hypothetical protein [Pedobacter aquatilis]
MSIFKTLNFCFCCYVMKAIVICFFMLILFQACKKEIPEPDVIKIQLYHTTIKYTNEGEPDILCWYVRSANKGGYFYVNTTRNITDFSDYKFKYSLSLPNDLTNKSPVRDLIVRINQLNGDMYFDIMGREKQPKN